MQLRNVLLGSFAFAVCLASAEVAVGLSSRGAIPRQVLRRIASAPDTIDILAIGNSLVEAGFGAAEVTTRLAIGDRPIVAVNAGLGASGVIEQLILVRRALLTHHVRLIVYGTFDHQMAVDVVRTNADLIGNHAMLYYQDADVAATYLPFDWANQVLFAICRRSAILRERGTIWARVERLRRRLGEAGMPKAATNAFGRAADFSLLEASSESTFVSDTDAILRSGVLLSAPVQDLLSLAKGRGTHVLVVEMPMHPTHLTRYYTSQSWRRFRQRTLEAVEHFGADYIDASHWVPDSVLFADPLHLSAEGARDFSDRLAEFLRGSRWTVR